MFKPVNFIAKLFKAYLKMIDHPGKIRIQNWIGRNIFKKGILFKDDEATYFKLNANDWITRIILLEGNYENKSVSLAKRIMQNGSVFIDIGANFGLYSCQIARIDAGLKIFAIEPNYKIIGSLLTNIQLNKLNNQVNVVNAAVTDSATLVQMEQGAADNMGNTKTTKLEVGNFSVVGIPLKNILEEKDIKEVDLLKIDIEGNEFEVFKNFSFNQFKIRNIILEFNRNAQLRFTDLNYFFSNNNYECLNILGEKITEESLAIPEDNIWLTLKDDSHGS